MLLKLRFLRKCEVCRKTYRQKHSCSGKAHGRPKSLGTSRNVPIHPVEDSLRNLSSFEPSRLAIPEDFSSICEGLSLELKITLSNHLSQQGASMSCRLDIIKSLVSASKTGSCGQEKLLELAEQLMEDCPSVRLKAEIIHRQSILLRLRGDVNGSGHVITMFFWSLNTTSQNLAPEDLAPLCLSQATNHAYRFSFSQAHEEISKWEPMMALPESYEHLIWDQILCVGRIMRGEGRFREARRCFETCNQTPELHNAKRLLVQSALADLYCELDYLESAPSYLLHAETMVEPEIRWLRSSSRQNAKGYRRLLLSFVEIKIRQGYYHVADFGIRELLSIYDSLWEPDIVDRLGHVRALIAFARVCPDSKDSLARWQDVLTWNRLYNPLEEDVFTCGVVYLFLCNAWYELGNMDKVVESFRAAMLVLEKRQRRFLIPGLGTYLFRYVLDQLRSVVYWLRETSHGMEVTMLGLQAQGLIDQI